MSHNQNFHPQSPHDESGGPADEANGSLPDGSGGGEASLAQLISRLDALGASHAHEAAQRGLATRVFSASVVDLSAEPIVVARIGWHRWVGYSAAAAVLGLAVLIPMGVLRSGNSAANGPIQPISFRPSELAPAGISEQLVVGLLDGDAALESIDPSSDDGFASVVVTRGHAAASVAVEVRQLLEHGGGR